MDIYVLKDPDNNCVRYVGITRQTLKERLRLHIRQARLRERDNRYLNAKDKWILHLLSLNGKPVIVALSRGLSEAVAVREEKKIIEIFKRTNEGGGLLNVDRERTYDICREQMPWNKGMKNCYDPELKNMMKRNQPGRKDIFRFDIDGNFIDSWISLRTMCAELGFVRRTVMRCLNKTPNYFSHKGFMFSYSRNDIPDCRIKSRLCTKKQSSKPEPIYGVKNDVWVQFKSISEAIEFTGIAYSTLKRALESVSC